MKEIAAIKTPKGKQFIEAVKDVQGNIVENDMEIADVFAALKNLIDNDMPDSALDAELRGPIAHKGFQRLT